MEKVESPPSFPITITTFLNPHNFYFKLENLIGVRELEISDAMDKFDATHAQAYHPSLNDAVLVYLTEWKRWVRGTVDSVLNYFHGTEYVIWCIDYGSAIKVGVKQIRSMPDNVHNVGWPRQLSFHGGLAKCIPIVEGFHCETASNWNTYLVDHAYNLINYADQICFKPLMSFGEQIFGDIELITKGKPSIDLAVELQKSESVNITSDIIPNGIEKMETIKSKRYEQCERIGNSLDMALLTEPDECASFVNDDEMNRIVSTVNEWNMENQKMAKKDESERFDRFVRVVGGLKQYLTHIDSKSEISMSKLSIPSASYVDYDSTASVADFPAIVTEGIHSGGNKILKRAILSEKFQKTMKGIATRQSASASASDTSTPVQSKKNTAYMPAGFERDQMEFMKLNY